MKLFIFGKEISSEHEVEIIINDELGLDITMKFKEDVFEGTEFIVHNCTEFHHLYNIEDKEKFPNTLSSAFESDIHGTGCTRRVDDIDWIKVEKAKVLHEKF